MLEAADLQLEIENRPDNVAIVRQALAGWAEAVLLDDAALEEVKTAVSEACNNVALHAYQGEVGPLEVSARHDERQLEVQVADRGVGMRDDHRRGMTPTGPDGDGSLGGMGIALMRALAGAVEFSDRPGGGTTVDLVFRSPSPLSLTAGVARAEPAGTAAVDARVRVGVGRVAGPVLGRVTGMLAARAGLSLERLADAQLLTDALAAHAPSCVTGEGIEMGIVSDGIGVILRVGPLRPGGAGELVRQSALGGLPSLIDQLADEASVECDAGSERLRLLVAQRPSPRR